MKTTPGRKAPPVSSRSRFAHWLGWLSLAAALAPVTPSWAQTPPQLVSVSPARGAIQVPTTSALVFVFDQVMDTTVILLPSTPGLAGTYEVKAPGFNQTLQASWGADQRTLTLKPAIQFPYATFTWTLNPPGALAVFRLKSKTGIELATASGTFTTGVGGADPKLGSSVPSHGATAVRTNSLIEFRFDQVMKKDAAIAGSPPGVPAAVAWGGVGVDPVKFRYAWSEDGRSLACEYVGGFPINTAVTWRLNPAAAPVKLTGESGRALAADTYSGQFTTGNAEPGCDLGGPLPGWGSYGLSKRSDFRQASAGDPTPDTGEAAFVFVAFVTTATLGGEAATGSVTLPGGGQIQLTSLGGTAQFYQTAASESALDVAFPYGAYTLRFAQGGTSESVVPMLLPDAPPPVPKITNFDAAQAVNAASDFTLRWNGLAGAGPFDHQSLYLSDGEGHVVFQAPNLCVPRGLPVSATSTVIPANTLRPGQTYSATLLYGRLHYYETNDVSMMAGYGNLLRNTYFTVKTRSAGEPDPMPATLSGYEWVSQSNPRFSLAGTVGATYSVERASDLETPAWLEVGTVTMGINGTGAFEDAQPGKVLPLFYRAVAK